MPSNSLPQSGNTSSPRSVAFPRAFGTRFTWKAADLDESLCFTALPTAVEAELDQVVAAIDADTLEIETLDATAFDIPATTAFMLAIHDTLRNGIGFSILDRLPVERWGVPATRCIAWMLTGMLGQIVEQKHNGLRIYDVRDTGKTLEQGVRRSITNLEQEFHTDGGWLPEPPEFIALACLRQASKGGMSRVSSLATAHDLLLEQSPDFLSRLYLPLWWDRQGEHAKNDPLCSHWPIFSVRGSDIDVRYYDDYVKQGHRLMNEPLDAETVTALDAFKAAIEKPEHCFDLYLEPGQIEFVNNRTIAHARTRFEDKNRRDERRHLVRLWVRTGGGTALEPAA